MLTAAGENAWRDRPGSGKPDVCHFIAKAEYFAALDDRKTMKRLRRTRRLGEDLKHVQDAWVLTRLRDVEGCGFSRSAAPTPTRWHHCP